MNSQNSQISEHIARELSAFKSLFDCFDKAGFQFYAVGGCVRDWVLGRIPKDIDFTTDALPQQTKQILSSSGYPIIPVGELFGTIATEIRGKTYEITTYRVKESYMRGSRHPIVCYGSSLLLDLERRDLTINAMAADRQGMIIDPFDGGGDLTRRVLRVPNSSYMKSVEIFADDPLRILRLARFKSRFHFSVCEDATRAAQFMAGSVLTVSRERWASELDGLLQSDAPSDGLTWLDSVGVLSLLFPEIVALKLTKREAVSLSGVPMRHSQTDLWSQTLARTDLASPEYEGRWSAFFSLFGYATSEHGAWGDSVSAMLASEAALRLKLSSARSRVILQSLKPLPEGEPTYRAVRELAICLGNEIDVWNRFQEIKLHTLPKELRLDENARLNKWREALKPYFKDPESAEIHLPHDLSNALIQNMGLRGKTLGLYLEFCREAILSQTLPESAHAEDFVMLCQKHASEAQKRAQESSSCEQN